MRLIHDLTTPIHLRMNPLSNVTTPNMGAFPLFNKKDVPFNRSHDKEEKIKQVSKVISFLNVTNYNHKRYLKDGNKTFCNIYTYDFCHLMGKEINAYYVPRVWWTQAAASKLSEGIPQIPIYGATIKEMQANDLFSWFISYGQNFGWVRETDADLLQAYVNDSGNIGIIVGKNNSGKSGHITVVVPEQSVIPLGIITAVRDNNNRIINPLQSQAGSQNFEYGHLTINGYPWFTQDHTSQFYIFMQP